MKVYTLRHKGGEFLAVESYKRGRLVDEPSTSCLYADIKNAEKRKQRVWMDGYLAPAADFEVIAFELVEVKKDE